MLQKQHEATERSEIHRLLHVAVTGIWLIFIRHGNDFKYCLFKGKTMNFIKVGDNVNAEQKRNVT